MRYNNTAHFERRALDGHFMKAIVCTQYGPPDVLQLKEIATPAPADDEVLVRLLAASVNPLDWHLMRGDVRLMSGGLLKHDTRSSALTSQGELKRLAET